MNEVNDGVVRSAPIVAAIGADTLASLQGLTLNELFYIVTIAYTCLQFALAIIKAVRDARNDNKGGKG